MNAIRVCADQLAILGDPYKPEDLIERVLEGLQDSNYQAVIDATNARDSLITFDELHEKLLIREVSLRTTTTSTPTPLPASVHALTPVLILPPLKIKTLITVTLPITNKLGPITRKITPPRAKDIKVSVNIVTPKVTPYIVVLLSSNIFLLPGLLFLQPLPNLIHLKPMPLQPITLLLRLRGFLIPVLLIILPKICLILHSIILMMEPKKS